MTQRRSLAFAFVAFPLIKADCRAHSNRRFNSVGSGTAKTPHVGLFFIERLVLAIEAFGEERRVDH